jgi:group I intron endonuclease
MDRYGIYLIRNIESNKVYIGSTGSTMGFKKRWNKHIWQLNNNKHVNKHLQRSWNKYGKKSFEFMVIEECKDSILIQREQAWMDYYNSRNKNNGYNTKKAGTHGKHNEDTKKKMKISHQKRWKALGGKHTEITKKKMSRNHADFSGKNNPNYGKHPSKATRLKLSLWQKGKPKKKRISI